MKHKVGKYSNGVSESDGPEQKVGNSNLGYMAKGSLVNDLHNPLDPRSKPKPTVAGAAASLTVHRGKGR